MIAALDRKPFPSKTVYSLFSPLNEFLLAKPNVGIRKVFPLFSLSDLCIERSLKILLVTSKAFQFFDCRTRGISIN